MRTRGAKRKRHLGLKCGGWANARALFTLHASRSHFTLHVSTLHGHLARARKQDWQPPGALEASSMDAFCVDCGGREKCSRLVPDVLHRRSNIMNISSIEKQDVL
jgi:hypothetical protein